MSQPATNRDKWLDYALLVFIGGMTVLFVGELLVSLSWRMRHDFPLLHYVAFLIDQHGFMPYRDIFETSMPGTFLFHLAIVKTVGYSDFGFRLVDVLYIVLLLGITWKLMARFGQIVALASVVHFGIVYLETSGQHSLQRDCVGILPVAAAVLLATTAYASRRPYLAAVLIGALFALSAALKPHQAIGLPLVLFYLAFGAEEQNALPMRSVIIRLVGLGASATIGFVLVFSLPILWLWKMGALPYFWDMFSNYLPLHLQLSGEHVAIPSSERLAYLLANYRKFGGKGTLSIAAVLGAYFVFADQQFTQQRKFVLLLLSLLFVYSIYPAIAGQFFGYHWFPFIFFGCVTASLVLLPAVRASAPTYQRAFSLVVFLLVFATTVQPAGNFVRPLFGHAQGLPKGGRADEIADFLKHNLKPGEKVQPLDWTSGAIHGMLMARAVVATPFIYDYHFYHNISNPYIQGLRRKFIERLTVERPRFIIDVLVAERPSGVDTASEFPELRAFIAENYRSVYEGDGFIVYERQG
jgi:hypothetical protein